MAGLDKEIPRLKLADGQSIPMLGYGTGTSWYQKEANGSVNKSLVEMATKAAQMGYVHLDGAEMYNTERELGEAIKASKIPRDRLFITTKVHTNIQDIPHGIDASLKKLGLEYVDLYLIHSPFFAGSDDNLQQKWRDMEAVKKAGKARSIGVSNYSQHHLEATLKTATDPPAINQIEFHPYLLRASSDLLAYHRKHNIALSAYSPLVPITRKDAAKTDEGGGTPPLLDYLDRLARKYYVEPAEILLRWCIDQDIVPITTTTKPQRMSDYLRVLTFRLTPRELDDLGDLGRQVHFRAYFRRQMGEADPAQDGKGK